MIDWLTIIPSFPLPTKIDMKSQINMCLFMFVTFILIKIKIKKEIDISKDELLETMWEHKKRKNQVDHHS
jgi:hypothetical protein